MMTQERPAVLPDGQDGEPEQEIEADGQPEQEIEIEADGEPEQEIEADDGDDPGDIQQQQQDGDDPGDIQQQQQDGDEDPGDIQPQDEAPIEAGFVRKLLQWTVSFVRQRPYFAGVAVTHLIAITTSFFLFIPVLARNAYGAPALKCLKYLAGYSLVILRCFCALRRGHRVGFGQVSFSRFVRSLSSSVVPLVDLAEKGQHHIRLVLLTSRSDLAKIDLVTTTRNVNTVSIILCSISLLVLLALMLANWFTQIPPHAQGEENINGQNVADVEAGNDIPLENLENPEEIDDLERGPDQVVAPNEDRNKIMLERYHILTQSTTRVFDLILLIIYLATAGRLSVHNPQPFYLIFVALSLCVVGCVLSLIIFWVFHVKGYCTFR
ncbi:hypothetical protein WICPIJ_009515 [Wickerhamomyces pijperi]|uniref:Uncharacterized protein n=1 Tax=Wickerhamomyces pijperi TaxID=599730 RepID=A0A9P8PMF2_WICPI|nr:hypothetical protein WICPIJ_009515 [Wickerhamomyces pijperi]